MTIVSVEPHTDPRWRKLVEHQRSDVFHSPAWMRVLAETYDFDLRAQILMEQPLVKLVDIPMVMFLH